MMPATSGASARSATTSKIGGRLGYASGFDVGRALRPDHDVDVLVVDRLGRGELALQVVAEVLGRIEVAGLRVALHGADPDASSPVRGARQRRPGGHGEQAQDDGARRSSDALHRERRAAPHLDRRGAARNTIDEPDARRPRARRTARASGLSDCENATRPQENPPYGQTAAMPSRAIQSPATTAGSSRSRPGPVGQTRGSQRYAQVISRAPSRTRAPSSTDSADHGIGPRKTAAHSMCGK